MSKEMNGLQCKDEKVGDGLFGGCEEDVTATEFRAAIMPTVFRDTMEYARDRALAGLVI